MYKAGMIFCRFKSDFQFFFLSNLYTFSYFLVLEAPSIFEFPIFLLNINIIPDIIKLP